MSQGACNQPDCDALHKICPCRLIGIGRRIIRQHPAPAKLETRTCTSASVLPYAPQLPKGGCTAMKRKNANIKHNAPQAPIGGLVLQRGYDCLRNHFLLKTMQIAWCKCFACDKRLHTHTHISHMEHACRFRIKHETTHAIFR